MFLIASTLVAGLASSSWASPMPQAVSQVSADCAVLNEAFPAVFNAAVDCCQGPNYCEGGHITHLNLYARNLSGPIPTTLSKLTSLKNIDMSWNSLTGLIPDIFGSFTNLTDLNLSGNPLNGTLPASILNSPILGNLIINDTPGLTGTFGNDSKTLPKLTGYIVNNSGASIVDPLASRASNMYVDPNNIPPPPPPCDPENDPECQQHQPNDCPDC